MISDFIKKLHITPLRKPHSILWYKHRTETKQKTKNKAIKYKDICVLQEKKESWKRCCLHPPSTLKSFTSTAKNDVFLFTLYSAVNQDHQVIYPLHLHHDEYGVKSNISQYRWCERISSEEPLNAKRLSHKLGLWEDLWWESMDPRGKWILCE